MEEFIGIVKLFAGNFAPKGWALCNGQLLPISQYSAVFSLLGTTYGGDGVTTFALPDLRGRVVVGTGQGNGTSNYIEGQMGGVENTTLLVQNIPPHTHIATLNVNGTDSTDSVPARGGSIAVPGVQSSRTFTPTLGFNSATPDVPLNPASVTNAPSGGGMPISIMQPFNSMYYIICLEGIYPSRP